MEKFERLIEYVINDEEAKARELFHEIVVEKSRDIYENLMSDEDMEDLGGDAADDFIGDIEADEEGASLEFDDAEIGDVDAEIDGVEMPDEDAEEDIEELEDRVVGVEDKLDELMAEFEALMSSEEGDVEGDEMGDVESFDDVEDTEDAEDMGDSESEEDDEEELADLAEALELQAAPKPKTSEESFVHSKSTVAANAGAKGSAAKPASLGSGEETGRKAPEAKDQGHTTHIDKLGKAPSPKDSEPSEVNTKSTLK